MTFFVLRLGAFNSGNKDRPKIFQLPVIFNVGVLRCAHSVHFGTRAACRLIIEVCITSHDTMYDDWVGWKGILDYCY